MTIELAVNVPLLMQPYISKALFSTPNPPVKLSKIAIGNGAMGAFLEYEELPMVRIMIIILSAI